MLQLHHLLKLNLWLFQWQFFSIVDVSNRKNSNESKSWMFLFLTARKRTGVFATLLDMRICVALSSVRWDGRQLDRWNKPFNFDLTSFDAVPNMLCFDDAADSIDRFEIDNWKRRKTRQILNSKTNCFFFFYYIDRWFCFGHNVNKIQLLIFDLKGN